MQRVRFRDPAGSTRTGEWVDGHVEFASQRFDVDSVSILPPTEPSKIVCVGLNYQLHAEETDSELPDRPLLFLKAPNTLAGHGDTIELPENKERIDYEAELGVVIGEQCRNVSRGDADDVIAGYTCVNDLSNRDDQRVEQNWVRGKSFDNSAPVGPVLAPPDALPDDASIELRQNGEVKQSSTIEDMIFSVPEIIEAITELMTLEPGDVIATGTPSGIGPISDGDTLEVEIEGVGTLVNNFVAREFTGDTDHDFMPDQ
ncbi:MAG: fumarylacetoacetate hydrolase family protein [Natronomonas sp.]|uniref:fumarylacetoacetate hydrolase family protein n=1 Tax=Natronomonas sp. TaxID=2184060 RepID=UPI00287015DF|nr:fumarylacetoacetate hydrolase family protein [Natronomonas sp.]MDR9431153.1 fumarylacetoacetate hydrolase family protein [Natronomonas sp.]